MLTNISVSTVLLNRDALTAGCLSVSSNIVQSSKRSVLLPPSTAITLVTLLHGRDAPSFPAQNQPSDFSPESYYPKLTVMGTQQSATSRLSNTKFLRMILS
ncbi:hypothetical protein CEXT_218391 [Caerostris extrusa]|uniref:Uncharacterized protein n=1 Tax=Caerostris extrusa TaxID=172846 RepID=A0AAV4U7P0_CAEEX|nr:hypothetical protein CEXT_218391 [Caerostris extrusa]